MKLKRILIISAFMVVIIIVSIFVYLNSNTHLNNRIYNNLMSLSTSFYQEYYYDTVGIDAIKNISDKGITVSLDTIKNTIMFKNDKRLVILDKCNGNETIVKIIPVSPYKKNNYKIELIIKC